MDLSRKYYDTSTEWAVARYGAWDVGHGTSIIPTPYNFTYLFFPFYSPPRGYGNLPFLEANVRSNYSPSLAYSHV